MYGGAYYGKAARRTETIRAPEQTIATYSVSISGAINSYQSFTGRSAYSQAQAMIDGALSRLATMEANQSIFISITRGYGQVR